MNGALEGKRKLIIAVLIIIGVFVMLGIGRMPAQMAEKMLMMVGAGYFGVDIILKVFYGALGAKPPEVPPK